MQNKDYFVGRSSDQEWRGGDDTAASMRDTWADAVLYRPEHVWGRAGSDPSSPDDPLAGGIRPVVQTPKASPAVWELSWNIFT